MSKYFTYDEFIEIYNHLKQNNKQVFVAINKNMHNSDLPYLKEIMFKLNNLDIEGIMYYDIALVNIKEENKLNIPLVWGQEHLTTNALTSNFWNQFGISYTLVSSEITKEEIIEMYHESKTKLIVTVFGHIPMFVSFRHLVKNYLKTFDLKDNSKVNYIKQDNRVYPIIDTYYGTEAYSCNILNGIKETLEFKKLGIEYVLLNSILISDDDFIFALDLFNRVNDSNVLEFNELIEKKFITDNGFFDKETIYKVKRSD